MYLDQYSYWLTVRNLDGAIDHDKAQEIIELIQKSEDLPLVPSETERELPGQIMKFEVKGGTISKSEYAEETMVSWSSALGPRFILSLECIDEDDHAEGQYLVYRDGKELQNTTSRVISATKEYDDVTVNAILTHLMRMGADPIVIDTVAQTFGHGKFQPMRVPLDSEWDRLVDLMTGGDDAKFHWTDMFSWVNDPENKRHFPMAFRVYRGYNSARYWNRNSASNWFVTLGFRPAVDILPSDPLFSEVNEGQSAVIGTLYMDGRPVKVPQKPTWNGDIKDYVFKSSLKMGPALRDPAYQVTGIRVGDAFVADRCLVKFISYEDIENALFIGDK